MNENKFDQKGTIYAKARPGYPDELFLWLVNNGIISADTVAADIGSGTGIFAEKISDYVDKVFAVEPNDDMRKVAEEKFAERKNVFSINGTAESTKLESRSIDFICAAQSFHWFDKQAFKKECKRILKDNGYVLLVWNDRDTSSKIINENYMINRQFCPNFKGSSNGFDFSREAFADFFGENFDIIEFRNDLIYDENAFVSRNLSSSYAPKTAEANYSEYISALHELFKRLCQNGTVKYPYITRCYIGKI